MSVISTIISVEIWISVLVAVIISSLAANYSFRMSRILFERIYRSRAMWTGFFAIILIVLLVVDSLTSIFSGSLSIEAIPVASRIPQVVAVIVFVLIFAAWIDSTIRIAISQDFFHRNTLRWASLRYLFWASILPLSLLYVLDHQAFYAFAPIPLVYAAATLLVSGIRTRNRTMRAYLRWIGLLVLSGSIFNFLIYLIPFPNLFPNLFGGVVLAYFLYRAAKSLSPTSKLELGMHKTAVTT